MCGFTEERCAMMCLPPFDEMWMGWMMEGEGEVKV